MIETISMQIAAEKKIKLLPALDIKYHDQVYDLWKNFINEWQFNTTPLVWNTLNQGTKLLLHNFEILINQLFTIQIYSTTDIVAMTEYRKLNNSCHIDYKKNASKLCIDAIEKWYTSRQ